MSVMIFPVAAENTIQEPMQTSRRGPASSRVQPAKWMDVAFEWLTRGFAFLVFSILAAILISLAVGSAQTIERYGFSFMWTQDWDPVQEKFGALIPIFGTLVTSFIAMLIGVPVSFGIALFLTELSPAWLKRPLGTAIELLAAIPSIIYGMWGLFVFAPLFQSHIQPLLIGVLGDIPLVGTLFQGPPMGIGMMTAGLILSIMVIPFITAVMRDVFELVPPMLKESAYGLGASTWEVVWKVVLPYTKVGVVGGIMLGLGRALGETMAVTMVIGNTPKASLSLFAPQYTMAAVIANEFTEAADALYLDSLVAIGLVLFIVTFAINALSRWLIWHVGSERSAPRRRRKAAPAPPGPPAGTIPSMTEA
jgi:phosphate transport system permease protein